MIKAGIIGGAGYTGGEMLRLLLRHPQVHLAFVQSRSQAGLPVHQVHPDLLGETNLVFTAEMPEQAPEVLFLCLGHGASAQWLESRYFDTRTLIIDLSQDYRLGGTWNGADFVYGLPEWQRSALRTARRIANPGCFATAIQLALLPLAPQALLDQVFVTGITGATGGGQALAATAHFPWRHANISAYKTLQHQHLAEIEQSLTQAGARAPQVHFVPWRGDFARGIFVTCTLPCPVPLDVVQQWYHDWYATHPFVVLSDRMIDLKMAVNTNKCLIFIEKQGNMLAIHATLDNLLKGAAGQAVQNMNLALGLEETTGLWLKPSAF